MIRMEEKKGRPKAVKVYSLTEDGRKLVEKLLKIVEEEDEDG